MLITDRSSSDSKIRDNCVSFMGQLNLSEEGNRTGDAVTSGAVRGNMRPLFIDDWHQRWRSGYRPEGTCRNNCSSSGFKISPVWLARKTELITKSKDCQTAYRLAEKPGRNVLRFG